MGNGQSKRVLIVDDEPNVAAMVAVTLEDLGDEYTFDIAHNPNEALAKLQQAGYRLLITDYNMPGMTGLDLAQMVRQISPGTQVILMTAYGTDKLRQTIEHLKFDGYIDKPATPAQIREIVQRAIVHTQSETRSDPYRSGEQGVNEATQHQLKSLQAHTGARCVLLISSSGFPVSVVGATTGLDVASVSALVAANFLAAIELANLLGSDSSMFKSSYYEGNDYNIYSYDINKELLLAVIFGSESKPGMVWFYTKQAAAELEPLVEKQSRHFTFEEDDVSAALDAGFDELFDNDELPGGEEQSSDSSGQELVGKDCPPGDKSPVNNEPNPFAQKEDAPTSPTVQNKGEKAKPMTFEQAVTAGLVPPQILNREQKR